MQETKKLIKELVKIKLTSSQTAAIESFINDRGIAIFRNSSLLKAINLQKKSILDNSGKILKF